MTNSILSLAVVCGIALSATHAWATPPKQPDNADPQTGATLYADNCASCHGKKLEGEPDWRSANEDGTMPAPPHDQTGHTWHHGDALLFNYTVLGGEEALRQAGVEGFKSAMPPFGETLSEAEIWRILAFIKSTWPARVQEMQATRTEAEQLRGN